MLTVRNAKPILAVTTILVPWDFFMFGRGVGWGLRFPFFRFVDTVYQFEQGGQGKDVILLPRLLELRAQLPGGELAVIIWAFAALLTTLAVIYALYSRYQVGTVPPNAGRLIGLAFVVAGGLFIVSRFLGHELLLVNSSESLYWFSIPIGAAYTMGIGFLFYYDRF